MKDCNVKVMSLFTRFQILKSEEKFEMFRVWSFSNIYFPLAVMKINFVVGCIKATKKAKSELKSRDFLPLNYCVWCGPSERLLNYKIRIL